MFEYIEAWDSILFKIYNFFSIVRYLAWDRFAYATELKKNRELKDRFKGKRGFVVLNGPSLKNYDLEKIENEIVICSNSFQLSDYYDVVKPNFHCIIDSNFSKGTLLERVKKTMKEKEGVKFVINKKIYKNLSNEEKESAYLIYPCSFGTMRKVRFNLNGIISSLNNVGWFCIQFGMYLGLKEIVVLGLDLDPGPLDTVYEHIPEEQYGIDVYKKNSRSELCAFHWYYYFTQLNSFYLQNEAKKRGVNIYNAKKLA